MASKKKPIQGSGISNAAILRETGLRRLTKDEEKRLGVKRSQVLYTSQKAGVKKLNPAKTVSKRQARQRTLAEIAGLGRGSKRRTLESERNRILVEERGARPAQQRFSHYRDIYADFFGLTKREVSKDPQFQEWYKALKNPKRTKEADRRRVEALNQFRAIDPRYVDELPIQGSDS